MFRAISVTTLSFIGDEITSEKRESILVHNILKVSPAVGRGPNIPTYIAFTARNEQRGVYVAESVVEVERRINALDRKVLITLNVFDLDAVGNPHQPHLELIPSGRILRAREAVYEEKNYTRLFLEDMPGSLIVQESLREIYEQANGEDHGA